MRIAGAKWSIKVNILKIECGCGRAFNHRADRWHVRCPTCKKMERLDVLRKRYVEDAE